MFVAAREMRRDLERQGAFEKDFRPDKIHLHWHMREDLSDLQRRKAYDRFIEKSWNSKITRYADLLMDSATRTNLVSDYSHIF